MKTALKKDLPKWLNMKNVSNLANVLTKTGVSSDLPRLSDLKDEELVKLFKKGDENAFSVLLSRHQRPVYNFIYKYLGSSESSEEAFQEVFLRVIRSIQDYKPTAKFTTWLYTIARNYCIDHCRKAKFRRHLSLSKSVEDDGVETWQDRVESSEPGVEEVVRARQLADHLKEVLERLNPEQKEVFLLRETQNLPFDEIAKVTGVSTNTVK